jgi:peptidoglycan/xylan/chitin deacetylase (PgdA/CDA1 family)
MRRWFAAALSAIFLIGACSGCAGALRAHGGDQTSPMPPPASITPTITPTIPPTPTPTIVPGVDAPWYAERNQQIKQFMRLYGPARSESEIDDAVNRMFIDPDKPMVALTFDDGPMPGVTDQILDILEQYNVRATFFVCGWRFKKEEPGDIMRRAVALGCEIGNHTWAHHDMEEQNIMEKRWAVKETNKVVFDETGFVMHALRPPGGSKDWDVNRVARENGMAVVLWAQSGNVHEFDPEKVAQNVQKQIVNGKELQDGDIILLHDTHPHMVDAVKIIVPQLIEQGYQLVTVWELLNCSEEGFKPGETYRHQ